MKKKKSKKSKGLLLKAFASIISGIFINFAILSCLDTYSWFENINKNSFQVSAASTEDILAKIEIDSVNPTKIILQKAPGLSAAPTIYFTVEGEAAQYIRPINPITLKTDSEYNINIPIGVTLDQLLKLMYDSSIQKIPCTIHINYLNEYINVQKDFEFTKDFVISAGMKNISADRTSLNDLENINKCSEQLIKYIKQYGRNFKSPLATDSTSQSEQETTADQYSDY